MTQPFHYLAPGQLRLSALPPLSLYVHYPWCVRKCPYCDFNSHEGRATELEARYLDALRADLECALPAIWGRRVHTVFIGGGTPSLLSATGLDRLLGDIRARLPLEADAEITLEANPGTAEAQKFADYRASGVNRLSLGIQSFHDAQLQALGRIHDSREARAAIETAQRYFSNINLDLMYALPSQSVHECVADVEQALAYGTTHLSVYHLTMEPNTVFAKYPPSVPDDDTAATMQDLIEARLADAGFEHYEVSAYARSGFQSRHNLNYWRFGDYLGIGAGAHSKLSFPERVVREVRYKQPDSYIQHALGGSPISEQREVTVPELGFEFMLNALRLTKGVPSVLFEERCGVPLHRLGPALARAEQQGLLHADPRRLQATLHGRRFLNDLQSYFLPDAQ